MSNTAQTRVTVNMPVELVDMIGTIAKRDGTHRTGALLRLLRIASYVDNAVAAGSNVIIKNQDGKARIVDFV